MLGYDACYRHQDNTLNFKTANPSPRIVAHEYGHYLFHAYNGVGHKSEEEEEACERFAKEVEYWYMRKMNPINWEELIVTAIVSCVISMVAYVGALVLYEHLTKKQ